MLEKKDDPVLPFTQFMRRMLLYCIVAFIILLITLLLGTVGYCYFEGLNLLPSFMNAALVLSDMGPVVAVHSQPGMLFSSFYALICGFVYVAIVGIISAPIVHRCLHQFYNRESN